VLEVESDSNIPVHTHDLGSRHNVCDTILVALFLPPTFVVLRGTK
jgi:hypothetical protein